MGRYVVEDGVITQEAYPGDRIRIERKKTLEFLNETLSFKEVNNGRVFTSFYNGSLVDVTKMLTSQEMLVFNYMMERTWLRSYHVAYGNSRPVTRSSIANALKINVTSVDRILNKLIDKDIIAKVKRGHRIIYFANPYIMKKGDRINKTIEAMFCDSVWAKRVHEREHTKMDTEDDGIKTIIMG